MKGITAVFACVGAVIGAGFASGREIMVFFSRYGAHSWWLIALACGVMTWLCRLCMEQCANGGEWTAMFGCRAGWAVLVSCVLMSVTSGAMIAAAGHLSELVWESRFAKATGMLATLLLAWLAGKNGLRVLGWLSVCLTVLLLGLTASAFRFPAWEGAELTAQHPSLPMAALFAAAYAAMNIMLAVDVICRSAGSCRWTALAFGAMICVLLGVGNALYLRHPELRDAAFPIVSLLNSRGRGGFLLSAALLYLSVFTTLTAVLGALRTAAGRWITHPVLRTVAAAGVPLAVSCVGFGGIVEKLYAPAGLTCLVGLFVPLALQKQRLDF